MYISRSTAADIMIFFLMNRSSNIKLKVTTNVHYVTVMWQLLYQLYFTLNSVLNILNIRYLFIIDKYLALTYEATVIYTYKLYAHHHHHHYHRRDHQE
jgi:hypothetical protein